MKTGPKGKPGSRTRTEKQKEKRKNAKNRVERKKRREALPGNVKRAEEAKASPVVHDVINDAVAPGQDVTTTSL